LMYPASNNSLTGLISLTAVFAATTIYHNDDHRVAIHTGHQNSPCIKTGQVQPCVGRCDNSYVRCVDSVLGRLISFARQNQKALLIAKLL
jgi:hypothetical protein